MTRHDPISAQTAMPPSRRAGDLAPLNGRAAMPAAMGHIYRRKSPCIGPFIDPFAPPASPPALAQCCSQDDQLQNYP
jgi:hypothetical protein